MIADKNTLVPPLIGRDREVRVLGNMVRELPNRLTVWGTGGVGKSVLAASVAFQWRQEHPERRVVMSIACTPGTTIDTLYAVLVSQFARLGVEVAETRPGDKSDLRRAFAEVGEAVLLIDGGEQLSESAYAQLEAWCGSPASVAVLVTSRHYRPGSGVQVGPLDTSSEEAPGVLLLCERIAEYEPSFQVTAENRDNVVALARRLGGVPFALEIAASQLGVRGFDEVADGPVGCLVVPATTSCAPLERHRSLDASARWSWDLLTAAEQRAAALLSAFGAGFTDRGACDVLDRPLSEVVALLQSLVSKSILFAERSASGASVWLFVHSHLRAFLQCEFSRSAERSDAEERHRRYTLHTCREQHAQYEETGCLDAMSTLGRHVTDLLQLSQCGRVPSTAAVEQALEALLLATPVMLARGPYDVLADGYDRVLSLAESRRVDRRLRARALVAREESSYLSDRDPQYLEEIDGLLAGDGRIKDARSRADLLRLTGMLYHHRRKLDEAKECFARALEVLGTEPSVSHRYTARLLGNLGAVHHDRHEYEQARASYERAIDEAGRVGDRRIIGHFQSHVGLIHVEQRDWSRARESLMKAIANLDMVGAARLLACAQGNLGLVMHAWAEPEDALSLYSEAISRLESIGDREMAAITRCRRSCTLSLLDREQEARDDILAAGPRELYSGSVRALAEVARAFADLAVARRRLLHGASDDGATAAIVAAVSKRIIDARTGSMPASELYDDVRVLLRSLERHVVAIDHKYQPHAPVDSEFVVTRDAQWCIDLGHECGERSWVDLTRSRQAGDVLACLVDRRCKAPGKYLSVDDLLKLAWDYKVQPDNVISQIKALRKLIAPTPIRTAPKGLSGYRFDERTVASYVVFGPARSSR